MKSYAQSSLVLSFLLCSALSLTSCSKDSDLFQEYVLSDPETEPVENTDSEGTDGTDEEEGSDANESSSKGDGVNLLLNGTFENSNEWDLLNGSTATDGILRIITSGRIQGSRSNWSAQYPNISVESFYITRRYRLTFTARRVSGNDVFRVGQRFFNVFDDKLTLDFKTYVIEYNGEGNPGGNDLVFGGDGDGDVFEIKDVILEDIGAKADNGNPGLPNEITFFTNFETNQWGESGQKEPQGNFWEVDHGAPRTTDHPNSPLKSGRNGGKAIWLGDYNNDERRNEVGKDNALSFKEHWIGVSVNVQNRLPETRILIQNRLIANGSSKTVNAISLRQAEDPNKLYFSLPNDSRHVDTRPANGAGSNTESVFFEYTKGEWIDIVIRYAGGFGKDYNGPDTSEMSRRLGLDVRRDGLIQIWVNGEKIVDHVGPTAYRYARHGQEVTGDITPKIGPYWGGAFDPQGDVYYDNYKIWTGPGGTFENLDPSK